MPDITNDVKPSADWLAFFTDLPVNLAKMATLRDELRVVKVNAPYEVRVVHCEIGRAHV